MPALIQRTLFEKHATAHGAYWTSSVSKEALRHHLRGFAVDGFQEAGDRVEWWEKSAELRAFLRSYETGQFKRASLGGDQEQGFESSFSSLAYAYLKDKSPRLLDYIIGFQLVDRNEDNTKAIGLFGFKVGEQWLYAPVFFLNGDLKGHELLYIKKQDSFVPMKENWVNYLISRKPHVLGEGSDQTTHQLGGLMPNLQRMSRTPTGSKYGSDAYAPMIDEWARPALPAFYAMGTKRAVGLYGNLVKDASASLDFAAVVANPFRAAFAATAAKLDLNGFMSDIGLLKTGYEKCYQCFPLIKQGFDTFYGEDFFLRTAQGLRTKAASLVGAVVKEAARIDPKRRPPRAPTGSRRMSLSIMPPKAEEKCGELYIYALDVNEDVEGTITVNRPELTDEEREKLLKDTVLIKDEREDGRTSIAYNTQTRLDLLNPTETGIYDVLEKPGTFSQLIVLHNPHSGRGREGFSVVVRKDSPKNWKNIHSSNLWAKSNGAPEREDWKKWVKGLDGVDSLKKGGTYIAVHENGSATLPFEVKEDYGNKAYSVRWDDYIPWSGRAGNLPKLDRPQDWEVGYDSWKARVFINQRPGSKLKTVNGELSIPDSFKIIKVADPPKPPKNKDSLVGMCCPASSMGGDGDGSADNPIQPGNLIDVQMLLHKTASVLKLHDTGSDVVIKSPKGREQLSKTAALISLVRKHGLREEQARLMLKEAAAKQVHNQAASFLVKYAYGLQDGAPGAPSFPEPEMGVEQMGPNAVQSIYPQEEFLPVDGMSSQHTDPNVYDPWYQPDQNAMQVAQQAAAGGQKEVFDATMIGGMLKAVRQDSLVDRYLGDLMKALDKLGRILFMFYWHQEEFEDRYGKQDLPELEDSLRNAFEVLGDVVLFLKEKTVQGASGIDMGSGVGNSSGSPDIQEASRN